VILCGPVCKNVEVKSEVHMPSQVKLSDYIISVTQTNRAGDLPTSTSRFRIHPRTFALPVTLSLISSLALLGITDDSCSVTTATFALPTPLVTQNHISPDIHPRYVVRGKPRPTATRDAGTQRRGKPHSTVRDSFSAGGFFAGER
jgi:hypothetical protein